ncbi:MAG: PorV/PorQ family protein, partial [Prolixibacteraceae bacterium]|nr:PorV/PorQ family protein [Prolixibacteraceae bacterium]
MRPIYIIFFLIFFSFHGFSQFGGGSTYDFLNLTTSARVNALGGTQVGLIDSSELSMTYYNPALLMPGMHNHISLNYINYLADINQGYVSYARFFDGIGTFSAGIHYVNYGKFNEALENGTLTGNTFSASDYALNITYSRNIWNNITAG